MSRLLSASLLVAAVLAPLSAAPAPLPRRSGPPPATEVVVEVVGALERIEVSFGARKVMIEPGEWWQEDLATWLRCFRNSSPPPELLTRRFDADELTPSQYISLRRVCHAAGYPQSRDEVEGPRR